jgi:hypothetical protein
MRATEQRRPAPAKYAKNREKQSSPLKEDVIEQKYRAYEAIVSTPRPTSHVSCHFQNATFAQHLTIKSIDHLYRCLDEQQLCYPMGG